MTEQSTPLSFNVAVVDDAPLIRDIVCQTLADAGLLDRCERFAEPLSFLEFLKAAPTPPDIVLLDVHFENSGLSGVDILPFIREQYPYLPIVLLTGMEGEVIEDAQDYECVYYIPKPVEPQQLVRMVRFYTGSSRKSAQRIENLSRDLEEHRELLEYLEQELAQVRQSSQPEKEQPPEPRQPRAFERVKEILDLALKSCAVLPSFYADMEEVFNGDAKLLKRVVESLFLFDRSETVIPGQNVHKYIDINVDNVYSLRLSRKARIFFYRSRKTGLKRLLRLDWEHNTAGMLKWLRSNYATYKDD